MTCACSRRPRACTWNCFRYRTFNPHRARHAAPTATAFCRTGSLGGGAWTTKTSPRCAARCTTEASTPTGQPFSTAALVVPAHPLAAHGPRDAARPPGAVGAENTPTRVVLPRLTDAEAEL